VNASAPSAASVEDLSRQFVEEAAAVADRAAWEALRLRWTGRKQGMVTALLASVGKLPPDERRTLGQAVNRLRTEVEARPSSSRRSPRARRRPGARPPRSTSRCRVGAPSSARSTR
jgi:hypothetical protein